MSLNFGRSLLAIPGPSVIPDRVLNAMHRPSPNIYEGDLSDMTATLYPDLKTVGGTKHNVAIYISNGHGVWEASLRNTLNPGDKVLALVTGRFGENWGLMAEQLGMDVEFTDFGTSDTVDPGKVEEILKNDNEGLIKAVMTVQTDTATSVSNDIAGIRKAIDAAGHDALYMVDCIASLGCEQFEMDAWGVDVMVTGCQKGLMTPAGLAFVYFNDKADKARHNTSPGYYWDWTPRVDSEIFYQQFGGTAPTHHLYGLREALNILVKEEGLQACWKRHETIASAIWAAIDKWGAGGDLHHNVADRSKRSMAVSAIATASGDALKIRQWTEQEAGVTLGIGLGFGEPGSDAWNSHFRIGHMGHQNVPMVMGALSAIDCAMKALLIDHGSGALEAAAEILARHGRN